MHLNVVQRQLRLSRSSQADQHDDTAVCPAASTRLVQPLLYLLLQLSTDDIAGHWTKRLVRVCTGVVGARGYFGIWCPPQSDVKSGVVRGTSQLPLLLTDGQAAEDVPEHVSAAADVELRVMI